MTLRELLDEDLDDAQNALVDLFFELGFQFEKGRQTFIEDNGDETGYFTGYHSERGRQEFLGGNGK